MGRPERVHVDQDCAACLGRRPRDGCERIANLTHSAGFGGSQT
jgi:hypothetical protein